MLQGGQELGDGLTDGAKIRHGCSRSRFRQSVNLAKRRMGTLKSLSCSLQFRLQRPGLLLKVGMLLAQLAHLANGCGTGQVNPGEQPIGDFRLRRVSTESLLDIREGAVYALCPIPLMS